MKNSLNDLTTDKSEITKSFEHISKLLGNDHGGVELPLFEKFVNVFKEAGDSGFKKESFVSYLGPLLGEDMNTIQLSALFDKIDSASKGFINWSDFANHIMASNIDNTEQAFIFEEHGSHRSLPSTRKDAVKFFEYVPKEHKYVSVSREGVICLFAQNMNLQRTFNIKECTPGLSWISDARYMHDLGRLVVVTDDRELNFYDIFSMKLRINLSIIQLEFNPLCLAYTNRENENYVTVFVGDDGGFVNIFTIIPSSLMDSASGSADFVVHQILVAQKITKKESLLSHGVFLVRRKVHNEWVSRVDYCVELNAFVSCASENTVSLAIGDLIRKTVRTVSLPKGIRCFEFCKRPSYLVTGGRDKIIRLWNFYNLSRPAGVLIGHNAAICQLSINHQDGHIISVDDDNVVKVWNARTLACLQTISEKESKSSHLVSCLFYDEMNRQLIAASVDIDIWSMGKSDPKYTMVKSTENFNIQMTYQEATHHIIFTGKDGSIYCWDSETGEKTFQFMATSDSIEITTITLNNDGKKVLTGSKDGSVKIWNYTTGYNLKSIPQRAGNRIESIKLVHIEIGTSQYIISAGSDRKIAIYLDDPNLSELKLSKILDCAKHGFSKGHEEDISGIAFCPPNLLASSSLDGSIAIWNIESGFIKQFMKDPYFDLRSKDERPIEDIIFLPESVKRSKGNGPILLSCHADGNLRLWEAFSGKLVYEVNLQAVAEEGLSCLTLSKDASVLIVGGSHGHLRTVKIDNSKLASMEDVKFLEIKHTWRAHNIAITSVIYSNYNDVIFSSATDATVRLWKSDGTHIGIFGHAHAWNIQDPSTFRHLPSDISLENELDRQTTESLKVLQEKLRKNIIDTWRVFPHGVKAVQDIHDSDITEKSKETVQNIHVKAIQGLVTKKWKEFSRLRKGALEWKYTTSLSQFNSDKKFYSSVVEKQKPKSAYKKTVDMKKDTVYRNLECHGLEELQTNLNLSTKMSRDGKRVVKSS